jgi:hypothetical protein
MDRKRRARERRLFSRSVACVLPLICLFSLNWLAFGQSAGHTDRWSGWQFLVGEWVGEGTGTPGEGTGGFTITPDLHNSVLVRRNFAEYPATKDKPAFTHVDLMVMYYENEEPRAIYFDNEGHVIRYSVEFSHDSSSLTFLSEHVASAPRFRFTYIKGSPGSLKILFDIAPPNSPDTFSRYIEATARRKH